MSDTLKLALRISAIDLFSGVLRRFRSEIAGSSQAAQDMQQRYDRMISHTKAGLKALAVGGYLVGKLKPAVKDAADLQESMLSIKGILQGAHPDAGKLADQMARVKSNAIAVASHMKFSATAVGDVTRQLVQGGVPLDAILDRAYRTKKIGPEHGTAYNVEVLAETQHVDPATTAMDIANVGHSFQLRPEQYANAVDVIARGAVTSSGTLTQLFHNLDQVGSRAHMYGGMDLKSTVIALKALAPLGDEAGSDLGEALSRLTGGSYRGRKWMKQSGFDFYDNKGNFIGLDAALLQIQKRTSKMTQEQRNKMLGLLFGQTGGKAMTQLLAPSLPGVKSYWEIKKAIDEQATLEQQNKVWASGFTASGQKLSSTNETTLASLFNPLLKPLTGLTNALNTLSGKLGNAAEKHPALADTVSGASVVGIGAAGGYGIYRLIRGVKAGSPFLKNFLRGSGNVAAGVAEGKAVEKLTGVVPVFVTNFPGVGLPFGGPGVGAGEAVAKEEAAAAKAAKIAQEESAVAAATKGAKTASSAALGMKFASASKWLKFMDGAAFVPIPVVTPKVKQDMAALTAPDPLHRSWFRQWTDQLGITHSKSESDANKVEGTIHIQIDQQGRASVKQLRSDNPRVHLDVGTMMTVP